MKILKVAAITGGIAVGGLASAAFQFHSANAAGTGGGHSSVAVSAPVATPTASPSCPPITLAIAFTTNVTDTAALHLHLPWGHPGDPERHMVEDYGAYDGVAVREQLPVHDVTTGTLRELFGHNAIDIVLDSGTPLYAVTSGTSYRMTNWTIPGGPQGWALVLVSDVLKDDQGDAIAFLYGHVREFDVQDGQHVEAGALIAKSGGDPDDPGAGFSDMANVHFEVIESPHPLLAHAGTVNPHQFLENLYATAATNSAGCPRG
ncbi:MAG TPA: M23 family metallopeptidase [Candidatus Dormibacteraeota bacterium]|nr:M23 family metallopeptidase [Candidatus Dormibacteraeota bacterium]